MNSIEERTPKTVVESHYQQIPESNNRALLPLLGGYPLLFAAGGVGFS
ncbi:MULTISPECIES: hypothetical protein [unclassified Rhodococcus (in: high G+C Gram-positive bacteria)]|nr:MULTISPECIES: hypothetical protein [unclassified Rhodococcus (in: high G+C Gram-positive bacteria)]